MSAASYLTLAVLIAGVGTASARDPEQAAKFRHTVPCPSTGKVDQPCPGYVIDHKYPLCAGGKDDPSNMQWQEEQQSYVKDRIERELCACKHGHP